MSQSRSHLWPGVPLALGAAVLFGASAPLSKLLVGSIDPWLLAGILYLGAGSGLDAVHAGRAVIGLPSIEAPLRKADMPWLAAVTFFGGMLGPLFLMLGLTHTTAASGSLLLNLEGLATMGIAWLVFHENVDRRLLLGAAAIIVGAVLLSWTGQSFQVDLGGLFIAAACLCWGIDNNLTRKISQADPVQIAMLKGIVAGSVNVGLALYLGAAFPAVRLIMAGAIVGFLGVGVSLVMFMLGLRHLGSARTGAYFSLAPFIGAAMAVIIFGDAMTFQLLGAGLLMGLGLWLHLAEHHEHAHFHDVLEHAHAHVHDDGHHGHHNNGPVEEPHTHAHRHEPLWHRHAHYPDIHHQHRHT